MWLPFLPLYNNGSLPNLNSHHGHEDVASLKLGASKYIEHDSSLPQKDDFIDHDAIVVCNQEDDDVSNSSLQNVESQSDVQHHSQVTARQALDGLNLVTRYLEQQGGEHLTHVDAVQRIYSLIHSQLPHKTPH